MGKNKIEVNNLIKISGVPFPLPEIGKTIIQPSIRDIALIGENHLMQALSLFDLDAEQYREKVLEGIPESEKQEASFDLLIRIPDNLSLFLSIIKEDETSYYLGAVSLFFKLIFEDFHKIDMNIIDAKKVLLLYFKNGEEKVVVDNELFNKIKNPFIELFKYEDEEEKEEFNPLGRAAEEIKKKIDAARAKRARMNGESEDTITTVIGTMASNYSIITGVPLKLVFDMTLPQLLIQSGKASKMNQRNLQNTIGAIHGFSEIELVDHLKPL